MDSTKQATPVLSVDPVEREQDKQQLVHRPPIVYVPKMYVPVPTVPKLRVPHVLRTTPTFVRLVLVDSTKRATHVLGVNLAEREQDKP